MLSVIIPVYNVEKYLMKAVNSVMNQSWKDLEIILIDDGSTDSSGVKCDEIKKQDSRIKVIHKKNSGLSAARNTGLEVAVGEYVTFLDSDDWLDMDTYEKMMKFMLQEQADMAAFGYIKEYKGYGDYALVPNCHIVLENGEFFRYVAYENYFGIIVCNKIIRRELFSSIRFPIGKTSEDYRVTFELLEKCSKVVYDSYPYYHYRMRRGSIGHSERISYEPRDATKDMMEVVREKYPQYFPYAVFCHWRGLLAVNNMFQFHHELKKSSKHKELLLEINKFTKKYFVELKSVVKSRKDLFKICIFRYMYHIFPFLCSLYDLIKRKKSKKELYS